LLSLDNRVSEVEDEEFVDVVVLSSNTELPEHGLVEDDCVSGLDMYGFRETLVETRFLLIFKDSCSEQDLTLRSSRFLIWDESLEELLSQDFAAIQPFSHVHSELCLLDLGEGEFELGLDLCR